MAAIVKQNLYTVKIGGIRMRMARASRETRTIRRLARTRRPATVLDKTLDKAAAERAPGRRRRSSGETPYHHGDLHEALLNAAERVVEAAGVSGATTCPRSA